ncbi:MAG TPA: hypothetical protein VHG08_04430 [Longimicrobium sp.]|nr:hypothetical protein [Longimicrobium sp.]
MSFRLAAGLALLGSFTACVKSYTPPEDRVFPPGRYEYRAAILPPGASDSVRYTGGLVLYAVTPDSLAGRWEVRGYDLALRENRWNVASYEVHAIVTIGGDTLTLIHSIERGRTEAEPVCRVSANRPGYHAEGTCTLHR